ncbi:MAG: hypothetical protein K5872_01460 [Rhizobiaceae bacterium]|nr:hypothetical protein [Rhizobiaceae bacterium]MCV0404874.1 hypothetical protein [Rhizobiaceae bacterium]
MTNVPRSPRPSWQALGAIDRGVTFDGPLLEDLRRRHYVAPSNPPTERGKVLLDLLDCQVSDARRRWRENRRSRGRGGDVMLFGSAFSGWCEWKGTPDGDDIVHVGPHGWPAAVYAQRFADVMIRHIRVRAATVVLPARCRVTKRLSEQPKAATDVSAPTKERCFIEKHSRQFGDICRVKFPLKFIAEHLECNGQFRGDWNGTRDARPWHPITETNNVWLTGNMERRMVQCEQLHHDCACCGVVFHALILSPVSLDLLNLISNVERGGNCNCHRDPATHRGAQSDDGALVGHAHWSSEDRRCDAEGNGDGTDQCEEPERYPSDGINYIPEAFPHTRPNSTKALDQARASSAWDFTLRALLW